MLQFDFKCVINILRSTAKLLYYITILSVQLYTSLNKPPTVCSGLHSDILNSQLIKTVHAVGTIQYPKESLQRVDQK